MNLKWRLSPIFLIFAGCASSPPEGIAPARFRANFQFQPGETVHLRIRSTHSFTERAGGGDNDQLFWRGSFSGDFVLKVTARDAETFRATLKPLSFEYSLGGRAVTFSNGVLKRNREAEESNLQLPSEPCEMTIQDDGLIREMEPETAWQFFFSMVSNPPSLLSWLGPLPKVEWLPARKWTEVREVMLVHSTCIPIQLEGKLAQGSAGGWGIDYRLGVDIKSDLYPWMKTAKVSSRGRLDCDGRGRPQRATIEWKAETQQNVPIADYSYDCQFQW